MMWSLATGYLKYQFAGIWEIIGYFGAGGVIVAGCAALYMFTPAPLAAFFPNIRKVLLLVAAVTVTAMIFTGIGVHLGEQRIQAKWDQARANAVEQGKQARAKAVRSVARKPSRWVRNHRDPDLRD